MNDGIGPGVFVRVSSPLMRTRCFALLPLMAVGHSWLFNDRCPAAEAKAPSAFIALRLSLSEVTVRENLRVHFTTGGPNAIDATDANQNGVPDRAEDVAAQASAALQLWTSLGYPHPLTAERYRGVKWIDVHLLSKEALHGNNGVTYDEIQRFGRAGDPPDTQSLCFDVATSVKAPLNLTPAHEMFHILQNSITFFKNRWFTEGTARWSERGLGEGELSEGLKAASWPPDAAGMEKVFAGAYETSALYWEPLFQRVDQAGRLPKEKLPPSLIDARYANGEPVLKDFDLTGWAFMREVLLALDRADDEAFKERKLSRWPEAEQNSPANNAIIHRIILDLARQHGITP